MSVAPYPKRIQEDHASACDTCYARIPESDGIESGFDPQYDMQCRQIRESREHLLRAYTEIMEENPAAFPRTAAPSPGPPAFRFGVSQTVPDETTQHTLLLETFPLS